LFDLATQAGRRSASRQLTGSGSLLGRAGAAARSYAGTVANLWRGPKQDALKTVKGLARKVSPPSYGAAPPVVPGLAEQMAGRRSAYQPATEELRALTADILGRTSIGEQEAEDLAGRVLALLRHAKSDPVVAPDQRRALEDILVWLEHRFQRPPVQPPAGAPAAGEAEDDIDVFGRADIGAWTDDQVKASMKGEIMTPGSSNVYSFFWVPDAPMGRSAAGGTNGTLFVTFKMWHPEMSKKRGGSGGERPNSAGPTYAYSNVPLRKYQTFEQAAEGSAGGAVWDYLRVRGTKYGHQHPYRLSAGVTVPGGGEYVPRKAVAAGLRKRTLVNPRSGQRVRSQLDEELGGNGANYSYAQWREIARQRNVDRGGADRGAPDRGRP
jgi:hypothetical protein